MPIASVVMRHSKKMKERQNIRLKANNISTILATKTIQNKENIITIFIKKINMKSIFKQSIFGTLLIFITSCSTISYVPKVSLDVSPKSINKTVQIDKFIDSSPVADRKNPFGGVSVTNKEALSNELDVEITNAIVSDFATNGLFKQVSRKIENPDYIIKGEIIKFSGKSEMNEFAKFSFGLAIASVILVPVVHNPAILLGTAPLYSCYLGLPVSRNSADIEIILKLYNKDNTLIGTYSGKANEKMSTSMYKNKMLAVPTLTNKTFSSAVMQIREQILKDISKIENP